MALLVIARLAKNSPVVRCGTLGSPKGLARQSCFIALYRSELAQMVAAVNRGFASLLSYNLSTTVVVLHFRIVK